MRISALLSATAMSLTLATGAHADGNRSYIDQTGTLHSAFVDQSAATDSQAGTATLDVRQSGTANAMTIDQSGSQHKAGIRDVGVIQSVGNNALGLTQSGTDNEVVNAIQTGSASVADVNTLTIGQSGQGNEITNAQQDYRTGGTGTNTMTLNQGLPGSIVIDALSTAPAPSVGSSIFRARQIGAGHTMTITQTGDTNQIGNAVQDNTVSDSATGAGNTATLSQAGTDNRISSARQNGAGNTITMSVTGDRNGNSGLSGYAAAAGAVSASAFQTGDANEIEMTITNASDNQFGFAQAGSNNDAKGISITGDDNELGVVQTGDFNVLDLASLAGSGNNVGLSQNEDGNRASITISGATSADNDIWVSQTALDGSAAISNDIAVTASGSNNVLNATQVGTDNNAIVGAYGNNNLVTLTQDYDSGGLGGSNFASLDVQGSFNKFTVNQGGFNDAYVDIDSNSNGTGTFRTAALEAITDKEGTISQNGGTGGAGRNIVRLDIVSGNNNVFGIVQDGNANIANGTITGTGENHFAISQVGDGNTTDFSQNGSSNTLGITQ